MFAKKSIVLLGTKNEDEKAVLSMEQKGDFFEGRVRLYNFKDEPDGILSLGVYSGEKVTKAALFRSSSMLYTFKLDKQNIDDNFSAAIINLNKGEMQPILFGSANFKDSKTVMLAKVMNSELADAKTFSEAQKILDENNIDYDDSLKQEIDKEIDKHISCASICENCKYKKAFFEKEQPPQPKSFFGEIKPQIDKLFENNNKEEYLEGIIPNSKWVKVEFDEGGDYYILGLIYEEGELKFIAYGVPGIYQKNPPKEISGYPVWLPLDKSRPESFGYWIAYQDAETGESIKAIVE